MNSTGKLTKHFSWHEATYSATAARLGISNEPTAEAAEGILKTAISMEKVRKALGNNPIIISSWYRNAQVNAKVGGVPNSAHMSGYAVDFKCPKFGTPKKIVRYLADKLASEGFDQLILEYDAWVHISFAPTNRRQVMAIYDSSKGYIQGVP